MVLIPSPILIRSDITPITRIKKRIIGLIAEKIRSCKGKKSACQARISVQANLHFREPEIMWQNDAEEEEIKVLSYKKTIEEYGTLITTSEVERCYEQLRKYAPNLQTDAKAILLL